jgi:phosphoribosylformylglycinamidine (FGAM) synthase-like enzyme
MGENQKANCDAALITPILGESSGLSISNGLCPQLSLLDPYLMAQCALDEAIRNAVCIGTDPSTISILDNFCWPDPVFAKNNPDGKKYLGILVKSCQGLYDAAVAMGTPLISGKDSMKNDFDDGVIRLSVLPTLLISAIGKVPNINQAITSQFKNIGDKIFLLSAGSLGLAASTISDLVSCPEILPTYNLDQAKGLYQKLYQSITQGFINSAHDISDGGLLTSIAESIIGSNLGAALEISVSELTNLANLLLSKTFKANILASVLLLAEGPGHIIVSVPPTAANTFVQHMKEHKILYLGAVTANTNLQITLKHEKNENHYWQLSQLENAWTTPLPFV